MDIEKFSKKAVFFVGILWFCGKIYHVVGSSSPTNCAEFTENSTGVCCLCSNQDGCGDNVTCPDGFQLSNFTSHICLQETSTENPVATTTSKFTTQYSSTEKINKEQTADNASSDNFGNLCYKCENNEYFDGMQCRSCHSLCLHCKGPSLENCTQCRYLYNETCVSECPNNTVSTGNNLAIVCVFPSGGFKDESEFPVAIVAGTVGGGVALIVVIIVIIFVLRRHQPKGKSRMSTIIEKRNEEENPDNRQTANKSTTKRPDYENQPDPGATFSRDIQEHGENIFRYAKDPTTKKTKGKSRASKPDDSDLYANAAMIRAQTVLKDKTVSQETLQKRLEQEEIDELPQAPALPTAKKRMSIIKRISKSFKMKSKKSTPKQEEPKEQEYMDMSSASKLKPEVKKPRRKNDETDNTEQEDYENFSPKMEPEEAEAEKEIYENMSTLKKQKKTHKVDIEQTDMQESYENMEFGTQKRQHSAGKVSEDTNAATQGADKNVTEERTEVDTADESGLEDYENSAVFKQIKTERSKKVEKSSPYENLKF